MRMVEQKQRLVALFLPVLVPVIFLGFSGCTEPGETTQVSAATGGVIGAGLGAIVGNQTGDAGSGLLVGAAAGAGTGALIGNALEAQEKTLATQDEAIERQEQRLRAQEAEIQELRRMGQDQVTYRGTSQTSGAGALSSPKAAYRPSSSKATAVRSSKSAVNNVRPQAKAAPKSSSRSTATTGSSKVKEATIVDTGDTYVNAGAKAPEVGGYERYGEDHNEYGGKIVGEVEQSVGALNTSSECQEAQGEVAKALGAVESADKLFHYRRALRLCPREAAHHNGLGEVYLGLNRATDAEFEFREALNIDPNFEPARRNLLALGR